LPPLFFQLISRTPFEQLANGRFVLATTMSTALVFALSFLLCFWLRGKASQATIAGTVGGYANIGYLGPGLTLAALGSQATVPTALFFTFDSIFPFSAVPFLMALSGVEKKSAAETALLVLRRVVTHPFIIATALGVLAAWAHVRPPVALDRMLEVLMNAGGTLRAIYAWRDGGTPPAETRAARRARPRRDQAHRASLDRVDAIVARRQFRPGLGLYGGADGVAPDRAQRFRDGEAI